MATVQNEIVIRANPAQPVQEIASIINHFLQQWPGSEVTILKALQKEITAALDQIEKGGAPHANHVPGNGE